VSSYIFIFFNIRPFGELYNYSLVNNSEKENWGDILVEERYKILRVNLSKGTFKEEEVPEEVIDKYIGGKGLAAYYLYNELKPNVDPLGPENKLVIFTGPLTGIFPGFTRHVVASKSPLTNTFSDGYAGGSFGAELAKAGYVGIIVEGRADDLVYLKIDEEGVSIEDASKLKGKTTYEVCKLFTNYSVTTIGPAGENLVKFACIVNDLEKRSRAGVVGRGGLGAVMGSKNLKAIVVRGNLKREELIPKDRREKVNELFRRVINYLKEKVVPGIGLGGNLGVTDLITPIKALPVENFNKGYIENWEKVREDEISKFTVGKSSCYLCPLACGVHIKVNTGPFKGEVERIEYETVALNGPNCKQLDLGAIARIGYLCNAYGVDSISTGSVVAFVMECSEKGLIDYNIKFGDAEGQFKLIEMIAKREGLGDVLAEGVKKASEQLGLEQYAVHIKGLEVPGYEPRGLPGMALAYATADRGADHLRAWTIWDELHKNYTLEELAKLVKFLQDRNAALWTLIGCDNIPANSGDPAKFVDLSIEMLNSLGFEIDKNKFFEIGERIYNLTRLFNVREGFGRKDDRLPPRFRESRKDTGWKIKESDFNKMLEEYYQIRGWDSEGRPTNETLSRLGIG